MSRSNSSLYLAIVLLVVSVAIGIYTDLRSSEITRQQAAIDSRLLRVQTLTEAINSTLATTLLEQNILRLASYETHNEELNLTLAQVRQLSERLRMAPEAERLQQQGEGLRSVQAKAVALMDQEQWYAAREILYDEAHLRTQKIYEISSDLAIIALTNELAENARMHEQQRLGALWLIVAAVVLLLWAGNRHSRRLQHEAREQARLRQAIVRANQELEHEVQRRTAELEDANSRLRHLSSTDALSGLANRRTLDDTLHAEWQRAEREGYWLALVMIDIDHFKAYNDNYGHQAGDACIRALGQVLRSNVRRAGDLAARYGGEEFVFLLPGVDLDGAVTVAQRLREAFMALAIPHAHSATANVVTISLGVAAVVPTAGLSSETLLRHADDALYEAKRSGRNSVQAAREPAKSY